MLCCAVLRFPCAKTLPVYFKLFRSQVLQLWLVPSHATRDFHSSDNVEDKALRKSIFNHIVRDIAHMNQKTKNQKDRSSWRGCARFSNTSASSIEHDIEVNYELRDFFFAHLKETDTEVCLDQSAKFGLPWNWYLLPTGSATARLLAGMPTCLRCLYHHVTFLLWSEVQGRFSGHK